ncbi:ParB N-terminal domain-containing protein [Amycolatopsis sp. NPDC005961]|uniref:ParB/RepB/Spo0J family partition protein n=1 Tax=Amycolatopsis sp. NPDC005961 TaxID=3156720 RepID=UPI0033E81050
MSVTATRTTDETMPSGGQDVVSLLRRKGTGAFEGTLGGVELPLAQVGRNPDNPPSRYRNIDRLANSVQTWGLIQPIAVVPIDAWLAEHPAHAGHPDLAGTGFVVSAGNRRHLAHQIAGLGSISAVLRENHGGKLTSALIPIIENAERQDLGPIDQAVQFQVLVDLGMSQRQIEAATPFSQSHISKRLSLLALSDTLKAAVNTDQLEVGQALALVKAPQAVIPEDDADDEARWAAQEEAWRLMRENKWTAKGAIAHLAWHRRTTDEPATDRPVAGTASNDAAEIGTEDPAARDRTRHRQLPAHPSSSPSHARVVAARRRESICRLLVGQRPSAAEAAKVLADHVLRETEHAEVRALAHRWLGSLGFGPAGATAEGWERAVRTSTDTRVREQAAVAYGWARLELGARQDPDSWSADVLEYLRALTREHGYVPSDEERSLMHG